MKQGHEYCVGRITINEPAPGLPFQHHVISVFLGARKYYQDILGLITHFTCETLLIVIVEPICFKYLAMFLRAMGTTKWTMWWTLWTMARVSNDRSADHISVVGQSRCRELQVSLDEQPSLEVFSSTLLSWNPQSCQDIVQSGLEAGTSRTVGKVGHYEGDQDSAEMVSWTEGARRNSEAAVRLTSGRSTKRCGFWVFAHTWVMPNGKDIE